MRATVVAALGVIAIAGLVVGAVGVWARSTIDDGSAVAHAVGSALDEPETLDSLATFVTDEALAAVQLESLVERILPPLFASFRPAVVDGIRAVVYGQTRSFLETDTAREGIELLVRTAHSALDRLLDDEALVPWASVTDGAVSVDLVPLVPAALRGVQRLGLLAGVQVPDLPVNGDPAANRAALGAAIGRDVPADAGRLVVYRSDAVAGAGATLDAVRHLLALARQALAVVLVVTVVATAAAIGISARRRRTAFVLLLAAAGALAVVRVVLAVALDQATTIATDPGARVAIDATLGALTADLGPALVGLAILAVLAAAAVAVIPRVRAPRRAAAS